MEEAEELKGLISEAHAAIKDIRAEQRGLFILRGLLQDDLRKVRSELSSIAEEQIGEQVKTGLDEYKASLDSAIEAATEAVYKRFDGLADILMGEGDPSQETLTSLVRRWKTKVR